MKIDELATIPNKLNFEKNTDDEICLLRFKYCHDKYPFDKLSKKDLKVLMIFFQKIESMTWKGIKACNSFNYETPKHFNVEAPLFLPKDATLVSLRVSKKFRLIGWRESNYLNIIWFDKNHESYPG